MHRTITARALSGAVALTLTLGACTSSDTAPAVTTVAVAAASTTIAPATTAPSTTTSTPTTVAATTTTVTGREVLLELVDGSNRFTLTTDTVTSTATFVVEPADGGSGPRWRSVVPWDDVPNASGHRPFDGFTHDVDEVDVATVEANRVLVADYIDTALVQGRWEDVDRFFRDGAYVLHGPLFVDGLEAVRSFFIGLRDGGAPFLVSATAVVVADGPYVLAINRNDSGDAATAYWDLWRIDHGAIVEHWDATETVPAGDTDAWFAGAAG